MQNNTTELLAQYSEKLNSLGIRIYASTDQEDLLLLRWWMYLNESGDIFKLIDPGSRRLSSFLAVFQQPCVMFYTLDERGEINYVAWFKDPSGDAIFCGLWIHPSIRATRRIFSITKAVFSLVFELYKSILGATWQPEILQLHTKIGYNIVGNFSNFMGQDTIWLVQMTREDFYSSRLYTIGR